MKQTTFDLSTTQDYHQDSFIVSLCNIDAFRTITEKHQWANNQLLLLGESGCGKTHLANIWRDISNAIFLEANDDFHKYSDSYSAYILDDINRVKNEEYLFHLINYCRNNSYTLLLTADCIPQFSLPDLRSRINAMQKVLIKNPDDDLIKVVLAKHFSDRQLRLSSESLDYMLTKIDRSFASIAKIVEKIDKLSLEKKRNITINIIKEALEQ